MRKKVPYWGQKVDCFLAKKVVWTDRANLLTKPTQGGVNRISTGCYVYKNQYTVRRSSIKISLFKTNGRFCLKTCFKKAWRSGPLASRFFETKVRTRNDDFCWNSTDKYMTFGHMWSKRPCWAIGGTPPLFQKHEKCLLSTILDLHGVRSRSHRVLLNTIDNS